MEKWFSKSEGRRRNYCRANAVAIQCIELLWVVSVCAMSSFDVDHTQVMSEIVGVANERCSW